MKLTKEFIKQVIKEELEEVARQSTQEDLAARLQNIEDALMALQRIGGEIPQIVQAKELVNAAHKELSASMPKVGIPGLKASTTTGGDHRRADPHGL